MSRVQGPEETLNHYRVEERKGIHHLLDKILAISDPTELTYNWLSKNLKRPKNEVSLISVGKASLKMAKGFLGWLDEGEDVPLKGVVVTPRITGNSVEKNLQQKDTGSKRLQIIEAGHPHPDSMSYLAGDIVCRIVEEARGTCIMLLSGGASSLMVKTLKPFGKKETRTLYRGLVRSGAPIREINLIRKHISSIKGGKLGLKFTGKRFITLVISDVEGEDGSVLDTVGSGPCSPDNPNSDLERCGDIITTYRLKEYLSGEGREFFGGKKFGEGVVETPKSFPDPHRFQQEVIFSNRILVEKTASFLERDHPGSKVNIIEMKTGTIGKKYSCRLWKLFLNEMDRKRDNRKRDNRKRKNRKRDGRKRMNIYIIGGEPSVRVPGNSFGTGGRVQHTLLQFLEILATRKNKIWDSGTDFSLVGFATDGIDGNSNAAGAVVDNLGIKCGIDAIGGVNHRNGNNIFLDEIKSHIANYDSNTFFNKLGASIVTGPTGTNVMDLYILFPFSV